VIYFSYQKRTEITHEQKWKNRKEMISEKLKKICMSVRLREFKESELLFLHDKRVPANNSLCERLARVYKRKQKQVWAQFICCTQMQKMYIREWLPSSNAGGHPKAKRKF